MGREKVPFYWMFYQRIIIGMIFLLLPLAEYLCFLYPGNLPPIMITLSLISISIGVFAMYLSLKELPRNNFSVLMAGREIWIKSYLRHNKNTFVIDPEFYYKNMVPIRRMRIVYCLLVIFVCPIFVFGPFRVIPNMFVVVYFVWGIVVPFLIIRREVVGWP